MAIQNTRNSDSGSKAIVAARAANLVAKIPSLASSVSAKLAALRTAQLPGAIAWTEQQLATETDKEKRHLLHVTLGTFRAELNRRVSAQQQALGALISAAATNAPEVASSAPQAKPAGKAAPVKAKRKASERAAAPMLRSGRRLTREYGGRTHVVTVEADGFRYQRKLWPSLTAIAMAITAPNRVRGSKGRVSGNVFFGVAK